MESSKLILIYNKATGVITAKDGIETVYAYSVLTDELVVRPTQKLTPTQLLKIKFEQTGATPIDAFYLAKRAQTLANSTHELSDGENVTVEQDGEVLYEWYTQLPQAVLTVGGVWEISLAVVEYVDLEDEDSARQVATSGIIEVQVNRSLSPEVGAPNEFDIYNLYVVSTQNRLDSEAWAVGQRDGVDVSSTDPTYHNNAKYYAEQAGEGSDTAQEYAEQSEAWAVGTKNGDPVESTDEQYNNNSKHYSQWAAGSASSAYISAGTATTKANEAASSAASANARAMIAATKANEAAASATSASSSATSASASAASAEVSAQRAEEAAAGIIPPIVLSYEDNAIFNSQNEQITATTSLVDIHGNTIGIDELKVGGNVYVVELEVPDRWISAVTSNSATFDILEGAKAPVVSVNSKTGAVVIDKSDVGLGNVDNTSDLNKPVSTLTAAAINTKVSKITATHTNPVLYSQSIGGVEASIAYTSDETASTIMSRDTNGKAKVATADENDSGETVANKEYVLTAASDIVEAAIAEIDVPVTSVNTKTGDVVLDATDIKLTTTQTTVQANFIRLDGEIERVDLEVADKVDKLTPASGQIVYSATEDGQTSIVVDNTPAEGTIPVYDAVGNIKSSSPVDSDDVVNKAYADGKFAPIQLVSNLYGSIYFNSIVRLIDNKPTAGQYNFMSLSGSTNTDYIWSTPSLTFERVLQSPIDLTNTNSITFDLKYKASRNATISWGAKVQYSADGTTWEDLSTQQSFNAVTVQANAGTTTEITVFADSISGIKRLDAGGYLRVLLFKKQDMATPLTTDVYFGVNVDGAYVCTFGRFNFLSVTIDTEQIADGSVTAAKLSANVQQSIDSKLDKYTTPDTTPSVYGTAQDGTQTRFIVGGTNSNALVQRSQLSTVATTGSYNDLSNKPTIPTVDQTYNSASTNAQSGVAVAQAIDDLPNVVASVSGTDLSLTTGGQVSGLVVPDTTTAGKVLMSTSTAGVGVWGDAGGAKLYKHIISFNNRDITGITGIAKAYVNVVIFSKTDTHYANIHDAVYSNDANTLRVYANVTLQNAQFLPVDIWQNVPVLVSPMYAPFAMPTILNGTLQIVEIPDTYATPADNYTVTEL